MTCLLARLLYTLACRSGTFCFRNVRPNARFDDSVNISGLFFLEAGQPQGLQTCGGSPVPSLLPPPVITGLFPTSKEYSPQAIFHNENEKQRLNGSASMYSEIQRERADIGGLMARPEHREWNPELIKPKKLLNPVKASRNHQEMHRELLMNHRRGLGVDSKPELQRVLEHRRRNQLIKKKKEELEAKRLQCPFEQELLRRQQRLNQLEKPPEKEEDHAPEFIKVRENLRRITTLTSGERAL
ncbi:actin-associated protein FAM107A isoform X1 [Bos taurus]|uniref:Actin-associated protein FAM107A n=1 Tax=Bos taurus TaxID=9913 RepID=A0AAA9SJ62_BOVIN|nr:actin-associated protein FAM107A isoform X1 [Bos taurus]